MPKANPKLAGLGAGGQGTATAEEMATRFPEMFGGSRPEDLSPSSAGPPAGGTGGGFRPPGTRPPSGAQVIDYTDRAGFEDNVLNVIGGNPFDIDPYDFVQQADANLPEIFNQVFAGKVIWSDRNKLDKDQAKFWNAVVNQYHAHVFKRATSAKAVMTDKYNFMMNRFDNEAKKKVAALKRIQSASKAPETRVLRNTNDEMSLHQWDPKAMEWKDTGKLTEAPKEAGRVPPIVSKAIAQVNRMANQISPEIANMLAVNKNLPNEPWFQAHMSEQASPEMQDFLARQWDIINAFYGLNPVGEVTIGDAQMAEDIGTGKTKTSSKGIGTPHREAPTTFPAKAKKGTAGKAKTRIKMDTQGNIIQ